MCVGREVPFPHDEDADTRRLVSQPLYVPGVLSW